MRLYRSRSSKHLVLVLFLVVSTFRDVLGQPGQASPAPAIDPEVAWSVVSDHQVREHLDWKTPALLQYGLALHDAQPQLTPDEILDRMTATEKIINGEYADKAADLLQDSVALIPAMGGNLEKAVKLTRKFADAYSDVTIRRPSESDFYEVYEENPLQWIDVHAKGQKDPTVYKIAEKWLGPRLGIPAPTNNTAQILASSPEVANFIQSPAAQQAIADSQKPQNNQKEVAIGRLESVKGKLKDAKDTVASSDRRLQGSGAELGRDPNAIRKEYAELRLASSLYSNLLLLTGDKQLAVVASDFTKVSQPIISFAETAELFAAGSASTLALANSAVQMGLGVASVFGDQSSPAAQQFKQLQAEIAKLRDEINKQFAQVNKKLDALLEAAAETLKLLEENKRQVQDARITLIESADKIDDLRSQMSEIAKRIVERDTQKNQLKCLQHKSRFGSITKEQWQECLTDLLAAATIDPLNVIFTNGNPATADLQPWKVGTELKDGAAEHIPVLVRLLINRGNDELQHPERVPNSVVWAAGVRGYAQFAMQWMSSKRMKIPKSDVTRLKQDGVNLLKTEHALLGTTRESRMEFVKKTIVEPEKKDLGAVKDLLDHFYSERRRKILLEQGQDKDFDLQLKPCAAVTTNWMRGLGPRDGLPVYQLNANLAASIHKIYRTRALGLMPAINICYSRAEWGDPTGSLGDSVTVSGATPYLTIRISAGTVKVSENRVAGTLTTAGYFDTCTNSPGGDGERNRQIWAKAIAEALKNPNEEYVQEAEKQFQQNSDYRVAAWHTVAEEHEADSNLQNALAITTGDRRIAELALQFGAPESLASRPRLADLVSNFSSARLPDQILINASLDCIRAAIQCSPEGAVTAMALIRVDGLSDLFDKRAQAYESLMNEMAKDDPIDQVDVDATIAMAGVRELERRSGVKK